MDEQIPSWANKMSRHRPELTDGFVQGQWLPALAGHGSIDGPKTHAP
jgi:hypothetical protein